MMLILANFVNNQVKSEPKKRMLVIDEGWLLLHYQESARFIAGLRRAKILLRCYYNFSASK